MIVGCYTLDLSCDAPPPQRHCANPTITGRTYAECARAARREGWRLDRQARRAVCPACAARGITLRSLGQVQRP